MGLFKVLTLGLAWSVFGNLASQGATGIFELGQIVELMEFMGLFKVSGCLSGATGIFGSGK